MDHETRFAICDAYYVAATLGIVDRDRLEQLNRMRYSPGLSVRRGQLHREENWQARQILARLYRRFRARSRMAGA